MLSCAHALDGYLLKLILLIAFLCSLIKMLYYMCEKSNYPPTWPQLEHAIKRNFGGLESEKWSPFEVFKNEIGLDLPEVPDEVCISGILIVQCWCYMHGRSMMNVNKYRHYMVLLLIDAFHCQP